MEANSYDKKWFNNVLRLKNFYVIQGRLPRRDEDLYMYNWYKKCDYLYRKGELGGNRIAYVNINFPNMFKIIEKGSNSSTKKLAPNVNDTEITKYLQGIVRNGYIKRVYSSKIYSVDDYIKYLRSKELSYILTPIDWYVLGIKYPNVFSGVNYGYYKLVCTNCFKRVDELDVSREKRLKCKNFSEVTHLNYIFIHTNTGIVFRDVYSFRGVDGSFGINLSLLKPSVICCLKNYKGIIDKDNFNELVLYLKELYGVGIDVFKLKYLEGTGSFALTARKYDVEVERVKNVVKDFILRYILKIGYHVLGVRRSDGFYGYDKL